MPYIEGVTSDPLLTTGAPVNGTDEVQLITYTATTGTNVPDAGTFTITFQGYTTTAIAFDATDAAVQAALVALPSIGASGCTVTVAAGPPRIYTVTFDGGNMLKRALPAMTTTSSLLQGEHPVTAAISESVAGVDATGLGSPIGRLLIRTDSGALYTNTGTALAPVWATGQLTTTASTAELNLIDGSVAGTAVASKALVLGANKNVDTLAIADSGLKLGAGAGTAVTATAAELNLAAGVTAGTAIASKNVTTDANIDVTGLRNVTATGVVTAASVLAKETIAAVTGDGAITIPAGSKTFFITKGSAAAMTLANPTATTHDGVRLTFISTTAFAHTLDNSAGAGFNAAGAAGDIGTFGAAIGNGLIIEAYQAVWYVVNNINVTIA